MTDAIIENFEEVTALAPQPPAEIVPMDNATSYYCSMPVTTRDEALQLASALSNADSLADKIKEVLHMHDYVVQSCQVTDRATGEVRNAKRIILMCEEGNFATISSGVETSMRNITDALKAFPAPWDPPIAVRPMKKKGASFEFTTLELVL